jgi:putative NADH-flavin reductase
MNIMLFGTTGTIGQRIYSEAVSRGHQVAIFVRPQRVVRLSPSPAKVASGDVDANGKSEISAEDYAVALVDELENGQAIRKRITFGW